MREYVTAMFAPVTARLLTLPGNVRGALWMMVGVALYTASMVTVKSLGGRLDTVEIVFFRYLFGTIFMVPFVWRAGWDVMRMRRPVLVMGRVFGGNINLFCTFYAVAHLQLAVAAAITFSRPLVLIFLAIMFLGEVVRWRRWVATVVGFAGVLIIVRPGGDSFEWAMLVALVGAGIGAGNHAIIKILSNTERHMTLVIYPSLFGVLMFLGPAIYFWRTPTVFELALLSILGVLLIGSQWAIIRAMTAGEATFVSPFLYFRLLGAAGAGFLFFAEVPDVWTAVGASVIVGAALYIAQRELKVRRAAAEIPAPASEDRS